MHLLWLTENYYPDRGGMAQSCDRIVHSLRGKGLEISIFHFTNRRPPFYTEHQQNGGYTACPIFEAPSHGLNLLYAHLKRPDSPTYTHLVAFGGFFPVLAAPILKSWLNLPLITCIRGNDFDVSIFSPRRRPMLRECMEESTIICAVTKDKVIKINRWLEQHKAIHTPNGIHLDDWKCLSSDYERAEKWRNNEVAAGKKVIGVFGHLKNKKGIDFLLDAINKSNLTNAFHLLMAGEAELKVEERLENQNFSYTLKPFLDRFELLAYYPACNVIAIPSFYDGMPNVLLEATALGVPIFSSAVDGMADMLTDSIHGFMFHPGDQRGCISALFRLNEATPEKLREMGEACKLLVMENYTAEQEAERYLQVLTKVATK